MASVALKSFGSGHISWPRDLVQIEHLLDPDQLQALVVLSWVKIGPHGVILSV